ncbi:MAG: hypothetical protein ACYSU0_05490 [Planctomycetota bacterium]|jgi:hypothetical protein
MPDEKEKTTKGELRCVKCPSPVAYVCHHCGAPLCEKAPRTTARNGKPIVPKVVDEANLLTREGRRELHKKYHAIPLFDNEFPAGTRKSGCLLPFFPDKPEFKTAMHCAECAARHHGGKQGFVSLVRGAPRPLIWSIS